jgi:transcriptional regulator with XRE-family HTH domain
MTEVTQAIDNVVNNREAASAEGTSEGSVEGSATANTDVMSSVGTSSDSPQWAPTELRHATGGLRDRAHIVKSDVDDLHHEVQDYDLTVRASLKSRQGHVNLLAELADARGMSWGDIAAAVGVSLSAVRKWRNGGTCTPNNRTALARLAALLDLAEEATIVDPAGWLLTEVEHGYTIRYIDLIAAGAENLVLDCAFMHKTEREALDEFNPAWRESKARRFDIVEDGDGVRSFKRR